MVSALPPSHIPCTSRESYLPKRLGVYECVCVCQVDIMVNVVSHQQTTCSLILPPKILWVSDRPWCWCQIIWDACVHQRTAAKSEKRRSHASERRKKLRNERLDSQAFLNYSCWRKWLVEFMGFISYWRWWFSVGFCGYTVFNRVVFLVGFFFVIGSESIFSLESGSKEV